MSQPVRLTELVRLLEQRQHVFHRDPLLITQQLMDSPLPYPQRLLERARLLDPDQHLQQAISRIDQRMGWMVKAVMLFWLVLAIGATVALMQTTALNFFAVLLSVLGLHTVMLLMWLGLSLQKRRSTATLPELIVSRLPSDQVSQALAELYRQELLSPRAFWHWSRISHQFWLCSLLGMLLAVVVMLTIRQYSFGWQSTLLDSQSLAGIVQVLGWLPAQLGFAVPSADAVSASQMQGSGVRLGLDLAREWAGLLVGSLVCYGLVPRGLVWLWCRIKSQSSRTVMDLDLPYYQAIVARWTPVVVDSAADYRPDRARVSTPLNAGAWTGPRLAVLLDSPQVHPHWTRSVQGSEPQPVEWPFWGMIEGREQLQQFLTELRAQPTQVLVGIEVRGQTVPDRGLLRQLEQIAAVAAGAVQVRLLTSQVLSAERLQQWQTPLAERGMAVETSAAIPVSSGVPVSSTFTGSTP